MRITDHKHSYTRGRDKMVPINPAYLVFLIVILLVFIFVLILLIGIRGAGERTDEGEGQGYPEEEEFTYGGYDEMVDATLSDVYGYMYHLDIEPSPKNTYFLDGLLGKIMAGQHYYVNGVVTERGIQGAIESPAVTGREVFAFTSRGSFLYPDIYEYLLENGDGDTGGDVPGAFSPIDLGYTVSGRELWDSLRDTLINSPHNTNDPSEDSPSATYPEGLRAGSGREFFDKVTGGYPGELNLTITMEKGEDGRRVTLRGTGEAGFTLTLTELKFIDGTDTSYMDMAFEKGNERDPFSEPPAEDYTLEDYFREYSER